MPVSIATTEAETYGQPVTEQAEMHRWYEQYRLMKQPINVEAIETVKVIIGYLIITITGHHSNNP